MDTHLWDFSTVIFKEIFGHYGVCLCTPGLQVDEAFIVPWYQHNHVLHICKA